MESKVTPERPQNDPKTTPRRPQSDPKMTPERPQNDPKATPERPRLLEPSLQNTHFLACFSGLAQKGNERTTSLKIRLSEAQKDALSEAANVYRCSSADFARAAIAYCSQYFPLE